MQQHVLLCCIVIRVRVRVLKERNRFNVSACDSGDEEDVRDVSAAYARCKPLAPMTRGIAMQAVARGGGQGGEAADLRPTAEDGLGDETLRVFYGNDTYYVLFRLHQYLYDRCGTLTWRNPALPAGMLTHTLLSAVMLTASITP